MQTDEPYIDPELITRDYLRLLDKLDYLLYLKHWRTIGTIPAGAD